MTSCHATIYTYVYLFVFIDFIDLCSLLYPFPLSKFGGRTAHFYTMKFGGKVYPLAVFALQVRVEFTMWDNCHNVEVQVYTQ